MTPPDFTKPLATQLNRLEDLMQREEYDEAIAVLRRAKAVSQRAGAPSAWVEWQLCIALDMKGDPLEALGHLREALRLDPVAPHNHSSRDIVLRHLRNALCVEDRGVAEPETLVIYRALVREEAADSWCHLVCARHHLACARPAEALRVLEAMEVLSPDFAPALLLRADVLASAGRKEEADEVRQRAEAVSSLVDGLPAEATQSPAVS